MGRPFKSLAEVWSQCTARDPGGCLLWLGSVTDRGYPLLSKARVHRLIWEKAHGAIPIGMVVRHRCDVRHCVDLDHLEIGTQGENVSDMDNRGRRARGSRFPGARLDEAIVQAIRRRARGGERVRDIAKSIGVGETTIHDVVSGKSWSHVNDQHPAASRTPAAE